MRGAEIYIYTLVYILRESHARVFQREGLHDLNLFHPLSPGELQDASFADLTGRDLRGKKFYKSILRGAILDGAQLDGASMFGSFAKGASFKGASLRGADLESVDFEGADLSDAVLEGAALTNAQLGRVKSIVGADFTDVVLRKDINAALCAKADGVNSKTGVSTRESLNCRPLKKPAAE